MNPDASTVINNSQLIISDITFYKILDGRIENGNQLVPDVGLFFAEAEHSEQRGTSEEQCRRFRITPRRRANLEKGFPWEVVGVWVELLGRHHFQFSIREKVQGRWKRVAFPGHLKTTYCIIEFWNISKNELRFQYYIGDLNFVNLFWIFWNFKKIVKIQYLLRISILENQLITSFVSYW